MGDAFFKRAHPSDRHKTKFKIKMEKSLGKDMPPVQRLAFLKDNCDKIEEKGYMKRLSAEEIQEHKEELSERSITINDIESEMSETVKVFKTQLKPLKERRKAILKDLKQKARYEKELCYKFIDTAERTVTYYNGEGDLVDFRPANGDELQSTIFMDSRKTGTDN